MQLKRYQWVGLLAGFLLFSGSWLVAYTNSTFWAVVTIGLVGVALWSAVRVERRSTFVRHFQYGVVAGLLTGLVARIVGMVSSRWVFGQWGGIKPTSAYADMNDIFRGVLNGGVMSTITVLVLFAAFGGLIGLTEPEQKVTAKKKAGR